MKSIRHLAVTSGAFPTRVEKFEGRDHLVVPVVALVQGVVYASNAPAPEFVSIDAFSKFPGAWDGRPIFEGHPQIDGEYVSGNSPDVLADKRVGIVFNAGLKKNKLTMEAWLDIERCEKIAPELLKRAQVGDPIEISVGAYVEVDDAKGEYNGKKFMGAWKEIKPDHLALLPTTETGACSLAMGCGVRAAKGAENMYDEFKTLRDIPQSDRDKMDEGDFAGPNRSFPIAAPEDVAAAAQALGRAKGDRAAIKKKIVSIAYRKGDTFVAQLPDAWKRNDRNATLFGRLMNQVRSIFAQDASETSSNDLMQKLYEALQEVEPTVQYVVDYFPVTDPTHVVYCVADAGAADEYGFVMYDYDIYERAFELSDSGVVTLGKARVEVRQVSKYEPVEGASPEVLAANTTEAAQGTSSEVPSTPEQEESEMKLEDVVKFLESATDCDKKAVRSALGEPAQVEVTKEVKVFDLTLAPENVRAAVAAQEAAATEKKNVAIKALKDSGRNKFTDEQLQAKSQDELDALVALVGGQKTEQTTRAAVDFSGQGAARTDAKEDVPAAPDFVQEMRAARGVK